MQEQSTEGFSKWAILHILHVFYFDNFNEIRRYITPKYKFIHIFICKLLDLSLGYLKYNSNIKYFDDIKGKMNYYLRCENFGREKFGHE